MKRGEVNWRRCDEDGVRWQVCAEHHGKQWHFYRREKRFENWQPVDDPPLEDWLELLDGVSRRVQRRLMMPDLEERLRQTIKHRFPEADID